MEERTLIFVHVPRAAGATLREIIARQFVPGLILSGSTPGKQEEEILEKFRCLPLQERGKFRCIMGYSTLGLHRFLPVQSQYISMLREPVERSISDYYFTLHDPGHHPFCHEIMKTKAMDIREFMLDERLGRSNVQTRVLSGTRDCSDGHAEPVTREMLETAKKNLQDFLAVGLVEKFDESLALFKLLLGWENLSCEYEKINVPEGRPGKEEISPDALRIIEEQNRFDIELYDLAKHLFEEQTRNFGDDFKIELEELEFFRQLGKPHAKRLMKARTNWIQEEKERIVQSCGPWTLHNIKLSEQVWTIGEEKNSFINPFIDGVRQVLQISSDFLGGNLAGARVVDLGCGEGGFGVEFALHGAQVVAIEGREANCRKALLAKEALSLKNFEVIMDDVRNLSVEKYGTFDIVLCLGILYHLDSPDVFDFVRSIFSICRRFAIIDAQMADLPWLEHCYNDKTYWGVKFSEHSPDINRPPNSADELWSSLDNPMSFWFTQASLMNLLHDVGFTSVCECRIPYAKPPHRYPNRATFVAIKGEPSLIYAVPLNTKAPRWPEKEKDNRSRI